MVGAIVLFTITVLSFGLGIWMFITAGPIDPGIEGSPPGPQALHGLIFILMGCVTLSAALVIDGLRHYASRITEQIDWILKPSGSIGPRGRSIDRVSMPSNKGDDRDANSLVRYHVVGQDQSTGLETELVVQVANETEALKAGERRGIDVQRVSVVE